MRPIPPDGPSDVRTTLARLLPGLGTDRHQAALDRAYPAIDPGPASVTDARP